MNTTFLLMAQFEKTLIPLEDICQEYFGLSLHEAKRAIAKGEFPVAPIKLRESSKVKFFIKVDELAALIDKRQEAANRDLEQAA
jgi:hypothetical protein